MTDSSVRTSEEVYAKYRGLTIEALDKVKITPPNDTHLHGSATDFLDMAKRYLKDSEHFKAQGMIAEALAAVSYAHGWLDAGARLGLFDVGKDSRLFTVDE